MKETEKLGSVKSQKDKIRERYKGIDTDQLDVIPALPQDSFYEDKREKRVAVYARVSTDDPRQTSSYELQKEVRVLKPGTICTYGRSPSAVHHIYPDLDPHSPTGLRLFLGSL